MFDSNQYRPGTPAEQAALVCHFVAGSPDAVMDFRIVAERPDRKAKVLEMQRAGSPVRFNYRGTLPKLFNTLDAKNRAGFAVYYMANATDGEGRRLANMTAARILALDLDGAPLPRRWKVPPHIIIQSSPGKHQVVWAIKPTTDFAAHRDVMLRLARRYRGDRSVADVTRVLRLPGFLHQKGKPFRSRIIYAVDPAELDFGGRYALSDFGFLQPLPEPERKPRGKGGTVSCELAAEFFDHLPAGAFGQGNYIDWLKIGMAMHYATGGEAIDEWLAWCASDPEFDNEDAQEIAAAKWDGFSLDRESAVTIGTLVHYGEAHDVPERVLGKLKFGPISNAAEAFAGDAVAWRA